MNYKKCLIKTINLNDVDCNIWVEVELTYLRIKPIRPLDALKFNKRIITLHDVCKGWKNKTDRIFYVNGSKLYEPIHQISNGIHYECELVKYIPDEDFETVKHFNKRIVGAKKALEEFRKL